MGPRRRAWGEDPAGRGQLGEHHRPDDGRADRGEVGERGVDELGRQRVQRRDGVRHRGVLRQPERDVRRGLGRRRRAAGPSGRRSPPTSSASAARRCRSSASGSYGSETAWSASGSRWTGYSGSGGGASIYESLPSYQASALGSNVRQTGRATPDVSAVANPSTGLVGLRLGRRERAQTGWFQVGGTSAGSPIWAGIVAAADQARGCRTDLAALSSTQTLSLLYSQYGSTTSTASTYSSDFHDITSGSNLVANATKGYDLVTGLGTPVASALVKAASTYTGVSASGVKAASAAVVVATPSQPVTPHAEVVVVTLPSAPVVVTTASTFLPIAPLVTPAPIAPASASTSSLSSSITTSTTVARALPVQPLTQPSLELRSSSYDEPALVHDWTTDPELLLDPSVPRDWPDLPPLPIEGPAPVLIVHDDAVAELVGEHYSALAAELASSWDLSVDFESATPAPTPCCPPARPSWPGVSGSSARAGPTRSAGNGTWISAGIDVA